MRNAVCADIRLHFGGNATCVACVVGGFGKGGEREVGRNGVRFGWVDSWVE